ncbi:MAG: TylF/MycF/NovP-related O-methyltransferase [Myxococcales bacterium]
MHNLFITRDFDWTFDGGSRRVKLVNRALKALGRGMYVRASGVTGYMTCVEQRINLYHMVSQLLAFDVPGDFIEVGTFTGQTAVLITKILQGEGQAKAPRTMHVYDSFVPNWSEPNPRARLEQNFRERSLPVPQIHQGDFAKTIPQEFPERVAFAHIDCGFGGDPEEHAKTIETVLTHLYPRMAPGAICSFIDYWHPETPDAENLNPGVRVGADRFIKDKPEQISVLYAGEFNHAYFRRAGT